MKKVTKKPITVKHRIGIDGTGVLPDELPQDVLDERASLITNLMQNL